MSMIVPNVEEFVSVEHRYRKLLKLVDWAELGRPLRSLYSDIGRRGYPVEQGLKCLFLQFLEDRSDRQMEAYLQENLAAKYFCNLEFPPHALRRTILQNVRQSQISGKAQSLFPGSYGSTRIELQTAHHHSR